MEFDDSRDSKASDGVEGKVRVCVCVCGGHG